VVCPIAYAGASGPTSWLRWWLVKCHPDTMLAASNIFARVAPSLVGLVTLIAVTGLWLAGAQSAYYQLLTLWGIPAFQFPFVDVDGSLAAWECARKGVDVILTNPCDILERGYNYSPFWMTIDWIPLSRPDRIAVGITLGIAFLIALSALPPSRSGTEMALRLAAVLSTMVAFAVERANPDLLIFILAIIMLSLLRRSLIARGMGYGVAFLAGAIKYYPFVLLGLLLRERLRVGFAIASASIIGLAFFWFIYAEQIIKGLPGIARGVPFGDMFAAQNFPFGMFQVAQHVTGSSGVATRVASIATIFLVVIVTGLMIRIWLGSRISDALYRLDESHRLALLAGALLLSGCFFSGQNVGYRGIFLLLVLPGLFALGRDDAAGAIASAARLGAISIPFLMWAEAIRCWIHIVAAGQYPPPGFMSVLDQPLDFIAWCGREIAWWFLVAFLVTIVMGFVVDRFSSRFLQRSIAAQPEA
jgi:hypothetical protein